MKDELNSKNQILNELDSERNIFELEIKTNKSEREIIQENVSKLKQKLEQKTTDYEYLEKEFRTLQLKTTAIEKQAKLMTEQLNDQNKQKEELLQENSDLQIKYEDTLKSNNKLNGEKQCLEALKVNLENEREKIIKEYMECKNSYELKEHVREKLISELNEARKTVMENRELINNKNKDNRFLEDKLIDFKRQIDQKTKEYDGIYKENIKLKNNNQITNSKLAKMQDETLKEITSKYTESVKLKAELDTVKNELRRRNQFLEKQRSSVASETELITMEAQYRKEVTILKEQLDKINQENANIKTDLNLTKNKYALYMKDRVRLENEIRELKKENEIEKSKTIKAEKDLEKAINQSQRDKKSNKKIIESYCGEYENKVSYLEQQIESTKTTHILELAAKKVEIDSLKRKLNTYEQQIITLSSSSNRSRYSERSTSLSKPNVLRFSNSDD